MRKSVAQMYLDVERLEAQLAMAQRQLEHSERLGERIGIRRARSRIERIDAELNALHGALHPIELGSPWDGVVRNPNTCDYCDYVFKDDTAKFYAAGICPRCSGEPLDPTDPNYRPGDRLVGQ